MVNPSGVREELGPGHQDPVGVMAQPHCPLATEYYLVKDGMFDKEPRVEDEPRSLRESTLEIVSRERLVRIPRGSGDIDHVLSHLRQEQYARLGGGGNTGVRPIPGNH